MKLGAARRGNALSTGRGCLAALMIALVAAPACSQWGTQIAISPSYPTTDTDVTIDLSGTWPDSCVPRNPQATVVPGTITVATSNPGEVCLPVLMPWKLSVPIGRLSAGVWTVSASNTSSRGTTDLGSRTFTVAASTFTMADAAVALRAAAGLSLPGSDDVSRLNVAVGGSSQTCIDLLDVVRIARRAFGFDPGS